MEKLLRFVDDLFLFFEGKTKQLLILWNSMNKIHPSVEFTLEHTTQDKEIFENNCDHV